MTKCMSKFTELGHSPSDQVNEHVNGSYAETCSVWGLNRLWASVTTNVTDGVPSRNTDSPKSAGIIYADLKTKGPNNGKTQAKIKTF